jgi:hypothetical protein
MAAPMVPILSIKIRLRITLIHRTKKQKGIMLQGTWIEPTKLLKIELMDIINLLISNIIKTETHGRNACP